MTAVPHASQRSSATGGRPGSAAGALRHGSSAEAPQAGQVPFATALTLDFPRVAPLSPTQLRWRGRIEGMIRLVEPALNLLLAAGDRVSRVVERDELEYAPPPTVGISRARRSVGPGGRSA